MPYAWFIRLPLEFPNGVHFGAGKRFNSLSIVRDGKGRPVLNGTSLAGALRTIWGNYLQLTKFQLQSPEKVQREVERVFGCEINDKERQSSNPDRKDRQSCVKFTNYLIESGVANEELSDATQIWTYHQRDRHRGTVIDQCLYDIESCPPGSTANVGFWIIETIDSSTDEDEIEELIEVVVSAFQNGVHVGGNSNRGVGRAVVNLDNVQWRRYDQTVLAEHAAQLNAHRTWRHRETPTDLEKFELPGRMTASKKRPFICEFSLSIPAGQDILVGADAGDDVQTDPQRTFDAQGRPVWRLPGSSLRGLFRSWMTRLAAREAVSQGRLSQQHTVYPTPDDALSYEHRVKNGKYTGELMGWCNRMPNEREDYSPPDDLTIISLFGSCFNRGRVKISDGYAPCSHDEISQCPEAQRRVHVAVDRITGGAAQGLLFDNRVLTANGKDILFQIHAQIDSPSDHEVRWLAQALIALHIGLLRVGSSKAAGRMEVVQLDINSNTDKHKELFATELRNTGLEGLT